ncbi:hypothetical protein K7432_018545 [Basidiobolus ranarum]|uniref:Uncharacterized protein n=1 Tax=Basidiobolus ranarum TaxID=34480 RepID=A0ABR2WC23_9FUNG
MPQKYQDRFPHLPTRRGEGSVRSGTIANQESQNPVAPNRNRTTHALGTVEQLAANRQRNAQNSTVLRRNRAEATNAIRQLLHLGTSIPQYQVIRIALWELERMLALVPESKHLTPAQVSVLMNRVREFYSLNDSDQSQSNNNES